MTNTVIGIDPGRKGGIALLSPTRNVGILLPYVDDTLVCSQILRILVKYKPDLVVLEKVHAMPGQGVTSMFNFGKNYGELLGTIKCSGLDYQLVDPRQWKKVILANTNKDKEAAINFCTTTYPEINLTPNRKRTPQDGIADAVCLAAYGQHLLRK